jgi:hypothetical protein
MRLLATLATSVILLATASAASAGGVSDIIVTVGRGENAASAALLSQVTVPVDVSGGVAVEYHGSPAAGCAAIGVCDVAGSITWNPGTPATLSVTKYVSQGKRRLTGFLSFYGGGSIATTTALVTRAGGSLCSDVLDGRAGPDANTPSAAALQLRLVDVVQPDFLATRCAGPLQTDLLGLLPVRPLPRSVLHSGSRSVDLSTTRPFSRGGFSGTLHSTVKLRLGPQQEERSLVGEFDQIHFRTVHASYRVTKVSGSLAFAFRGDPRACSDLDACDSSGTMTVSESLARGRFSLEALGERNRPWNDLLAALELTRHGDRRGIVAAGFGEWTSRSGQLSARLSGGQSCQDAVPLGAGDLNGITRGTRFVLTYEVGLSGSQHTHCAGPLLGDAAADYALASGSVPVRALRHRTVTVHLTGKPGEHSTGGYLISGQGDLSVTLRRTSVRRSTVDF